ncbi:MAG: prephenate dehydratase [Candidatus Rokubacteria bacterium]|nr:prephenate dehydratase [Candidatus Rokubacteria bacterium]MBI2554722.1 prephenate dehydratase [Candidatus Rokubacteria bacterium]
MDLDEFRSRINALDEQILKLLNQRAEAALRIGELKRRQDLPYFVPEREAEIVRRLLSLNSGPLPAEGVKAVWREILSASLALEHPLPVAYLGPPASFTHQAAILRFGSSATLVPARTIAEVFDEVERGRAEFGVVAVENSTEGSVNVTLDHLIDSDLLIAGELSLEISHHFLSQAPEVASVRTVCSHPQALAQCRQWLTANLPEVTLEEVSSTSAAAERAVGDPTVAAVASELAARLYDLPVLRRRIEDNPLNSTRFLMLGRRAMPPTGKDKTSILCSLKHEVGALATFLEPFARHGLNLTKIESRPTKRRPWEYVFFVDFEGHLETPPVQAALSEIRERCLFLKILGSYPTA